MIFIKNKNRVLLNMKPLLTITAVYIYSLSFCQQAKLDTSKVVGQLKLYSQRMRQSLTDNNFTEFANFVYPPIIKMAGGRDKMIELTKKTFKDLEDQGFKISDITIDDPSIIINSANRLQCVIQENLIIKVNGGHLVAKSYLIAISEDEGKKWYFIETSGKTLEEIKSIIPFLSNKIMLPKKEQPLFYND